MPAMVLYLVGRSSGSIHPPLVMHHVWTIPELRALITNELCCITISFDAARKKWSRFEGQNGCTLVSLALVCTLFRDPCLTVLWREIRGLMPFVMLVPAMRRSLEEGRIVSAHLSVIVPHITPVLQKEVLAGRVTDFDWETISRYSNLVWVLVIYPNNSWLADDCLMVFHMLYMEHGCMFGR